MTEYLKGEVNLADPRTIRVFDETTLWGARFGLLLINNIEIRPGLKIIDLGCATGFPLFELAHLYDRNCDFVGIDTWKQALDRAREKLEVYELPNLSLVNADGAAMPIASAQIDLVVSNLGINNMAEPETVLSECFRVLKPRGKVALTSNLNGHMREFYDAYRETLIELGRDRFLKNLDRNEAHRGTRDSICAMLQSAGFRVGKTIEDQFNLRYADGSALFRHSLTRLGFLQGWRNVVDPADEETVFAALEKKLNDLSAGPGELRLTIPMLYVEGEKGP